MTCVRLLVFDLDDTLFPEREYVRSGFVAADRRVRERFGRAGFLDAAWAIYLAGGRGHVFDQALSRLGLAPAPALVEELVAAYRAHRPSIALYPDVEPVIRALRTWSRTAIVSDGPLISQERKIDALGLARWCDPILLTDRWGRACWKPHPAAFRALEAATGSRGSECAYVGDNPRKDFVAPRQLGWWTVRVRRPAGEHATLEAPGAAHAECTSLHELPWALGSGGNP
jgi:putative hydrolase of the HAD superfamily